MISASFVNKAGRVVARRPSLMTSDIDERATAMRAEILASAGRSHEIVSIALIEPARRQIYLEHPTTPADFLRLIRHSPFVPEGRAEIYARGLHAGLCGDWLEAVHLLVPQFENSIRYALYQNGVIASGYDQDGIQKEFNLNVTLYMDEVKKIFPEDWLFDMQGLLVENCGTNLRNIVCHGLMDQTELKHSNKIRYFWWLTLRLVLFPLLSAAPAKS
jgi:hypothetical protein